MSTENQATVSETQPQPESSTREAAQPVERAVVALLDIGRLWAAHGLGVGRSALEASATTLRTTADLLGAISDRVSAEPAPVVEPGDLDPV